ncbi:MAG: FecR domain-containing protein [Verrucomicrobiota bacterium]
MNLSFAYSIIGSLALASTLLGAPFKEATVTRTINEVYLIDEQKSVIPAQPSDKMDDSMVLATGAQSRAELEFPDQTLARVGSNSYFSFTEGSRDMELGRGTMLLKVPKNAGGAKITTQAVTAAITGTTVMLQTNPGPAPVFSSGITLPALPGMAATAVVPTSPLDGTYKDKGKTTAVAKDIQGNVRIMRPSSSQSVPLNTGDPIPPGSFITTDSTAVALISPMPGVAVSVDSSTSVRLQTLASPAESTSRLPEVTFDLQKGAIQGAIARSASGQVDFKIRTPQGIAAARGTVLGASTDGKTSNGFSAHGNVVWIYPNNTEQPIVPGSLIPFSMNSGQVQAGASIPSSSPQFQRFLGNAIRLVNRAADLGLIRPNLPVAVLQTMDGAKVPLNQEQKDSLQKTRNSTPASTPVPKPPSSPQRNSGGQNGFTKLIVLEGEMRVFLNTRLGESQLIKPGQMIILNPTARNLPKPVQVKVDRLINSSKLVNGFETETSSNQRNPQGSARVVDNQIGQTVKDQRNPTFRNRLNRRNLNNSLGHVLKKQKRNILNGNLQNTGLVTSGSNLLVSPQDVQQATSINATSINANRGTPQTFPGTFTVGNTSTVSTNPSITTGGTTLPGTIYVPPGTLTTNNDGSLARYLYGSSNELDSLVGIDGSDNSGPFAPGELLAGFKADTMNITGNPFVTIGGVFNGQNIIPVRNLALVGVNGLNIDGSFTNSLPSSRTQLDKFDAIIFATEDGSINASGTYALPNTDTIAFYAREADDNSTLVGVDPNTGNKNIDNGSFVPSSTSDLTFGASTFNFTGNNLLGFAGNNLTTFSSIINADRIEFRAANMLNLAGASITANTLDLAAINSVGFGISFIDVSELVISAGLFDPSTDTAKGGDIMFRSNVVDTVGLNRLEVSAGNSITFDQTLSLDPSTLSDISVGTDGTITATNSLLGIENLSGDVGSRFEVSEDFSGRRLSVDQFEMLGTGTFSPFIIDENNPNRSHFWEFDTFTGNGNQFLFKGVSGAVAGKGGELTLKSSSTLDFDTGGFGSADFDGGDATSSGPGGSGGILNAEAENGIVVRQNISATTGTNNGVLTGGEGGTVDLSAKPFVNVDGATIRVSDNTTLAASDGGGIINISASEDPNTPTTPPTHNITIQNSSQLLSLLDAGATGRGGLITLKTEDGNGYILVQDSSIQADGTGTSNGVVEIINNGNNSSIDIQNATVRAGDVRILSQFDGGVINISNNSIISASNLLEIAAGFNSTNAVNFTGGGTIELAGNPIDISGYTVQIDNGTTVNNVGAATNVTANMHNYGAPGITAPGAFGSFNNTVNQQSPSP